MHGFIFLVVVYLVADSYKIIHISKLQPDSWLRLAFPGPITGSSGQGPIPAEDGTRLGGGAGGRQAGTRRYALRDGIRELPVRVTRHDASGRSYCP